MARRRGKVKAAQLGFVFGQVPGQKGGARRAVIFVERMSALAQNPSASEEARLVADLSRGPFEKKWGALLVALWLGEEAAGDDLHLRPWVAAAPAGS